MKLTSSWCMHPTLALFLLLVVSLTSSVILVITMSKLDAVGTRCYSYLNWTLLGIIGSILVVFWWIDPVQYIHYQRFQPGHPYFHTKPYFGKQCQDDWYATFMDYKIEKDNDGVATTAAKTMDVTIQVRKAGKDNQHNEGVYVLVLDYDAHVIFYYRYPLDSFSGSGGGHGVGLEKQKKQIGAISERRNKGREFSVAFNNNLRDEEVLEWSSSRIRMNLYKDRYCGGDELLGDAKNHERILEAFDGRIPDCIEIDVKYSNSQAKNHPYNWFQQGIMGLGALIPNQTFVADVLISNSTVRGSVKYHLTTSTNENNNSTTAGTTPTVLTPLTLQPSTSRLYMERYHGTGFPKSWMWGGCNVWQNNPDAFVSFAYGFVYEKGKMPLAGWSFGLQIGHDRWHSFSPTHNFGSLQELELIEDVVAKDDGMIATSRNIHCQARDGSGYTILFDVKGCRTDEELEVYGIQDDGFQPGVCASHGTTGTLQVSLFDNKGNLVWTGTSLSFACEFTNDYHSVYQKALEAVVTKTRCGLPSLEHPPPKVASELIKNSTIGQLDMTMMKDPLVVLRSDRVMQETTPLLNKI